MYKPAHFLKAKKIWTMGRFVDWPRAVVHSMSHALHYGNSVFEGIRAYPTANGPAVFRLPEHIDRLLLSARTAKMKSPYDRERIIEAVLKTMRLNKLQSAYIRPLLFYSYGNLGLVPKFSPVELLVGAWEWGAYLGDKTEKGVSAYVVPWRRIHYSQLDMRAKLGGMYVLSTINGLEAREHGCDEAIFLNLEGRVAEGPGENIFIVNKGVLQTNALSESILEGITRTSLLEIAADRGIPTRVAPIRLKDLFRADEAFFSGTAVEIAPIVQVTDGSNPKKTAKTRTIGSGRKGEITRLLAETFRDAVRGKLPEYEKWLTYVNKKPGRRRASSRRKGLRG